MAINCNIDQRGRTLRIIMGAMIEAPGWVLLVFKFLGKIEGDWPWVVGAAAILGGMFMIIEGALGWCAVRAMGFKTPV
ncbi:MAG: hypothetical protein EBY29_15390 [Planctomycetes bacterium]|nr:hypothetical protein [Planctomycetota bacterium]